MSSSWHFGNTTVKSPLRIREGLIVLRNTLDGNIVSKPQERLLAYELERAGVIEITNKQRDYNDMGRKWRSCLTQLGFITYKFKRDLKLNEKDPNVLEMMKKDPECGLTGYTYEITPNGQRMINAKTFQEQQSCMLRALLAYEVPVMMESHDGYESFKPFIFILQVLQQLNSFGISEGLLQVEMGIIQIYRNHNSVDEVVERILKFRAERNAVTSRAEKRRVDHALLERIGASVSLQKNLLREYAEINFRYVRGTGLFLLKEKRLVLNEQKIPTIQALIGGLQKMNEENEKTYLKRLWNGAQLPTDNEITVFEEIVRLRQLLIDSGINETFIPDLLDTHEASHLNQSYTQLEKLYRQVLEKDYAMKQYQDEQVKETIAYLKKLDKQPIDTENYDFDIEDEPAYLAWAVWRAFLAISYPVNELYQTRRFKVDQDFFPLGCSPEGGPDIVFEFEDYVLIVEVMLTSHAHQETAEGEPVCRHVAKEKIKIIAKTGKPVYGLFLGRFIDINTIEAFRAGVWYTGNEPNFLNIVPITLKQFILIVEQYVIHRFDSHVFRRTLDHCLIPRNYNSMVWKKEIQKVIDRFVGHYKKGS